MAQDISTVLAAGGLHDEDVGNSNYLYAYDLTGLVLVDLYKDRKKVETHFMERFAVLPDRDFDQVVVTDKSGAVNNVRLFYGVGPYVTSSDRSLVSIDTLGGAAPVAMTLDEAQLGLTINRLDVGNGAPIWADIEIPAGQLVEVFPVNINRIEATVTSLGSNTENIRLAPHAAAAANAGDEVHPAGVFYYKVSTAISAFNGGATSVWLSRTETERTA